MEMNHCTQCGSCKNHCVFLNKYGLTLGDLDRLKDLAYHCFLCGVCTAVCPQGIDGRQRILDMRQASVSENGGKLSQKGYGMLLGEKRHYLFRNYRQGQAKSLLFPGCNFPSFYPQTMERLARLMDSHEIGVAYDCCGKPIAELGMEADADRIIGEINRRLSDSGIEEVIFVCPNCYSYLKGRLEARMVTIYEKLHDLGLGLDQKLSSKEVKVFLPCPDRESEAILGQINPFYQEPLKTIEGIQCCGLGGCAAGKEPDLVKKLGQAVGEALRAPTKRLEDSPSDPAKDPMALKVYCASCAGALARQGVGPISHVLCDLLGTEEKPDCKHSFPNRVKTKWK